MAEIQAGQCGNRSLALFPDRRQCLAICRRNHCRRRSLQPRSNGKPHSNGFNRIHLLSLVGRFQRNQRYHQPHGRPRKIRHRLLYLKFIHLERDVWARRKHLRHRHLHTRNPSRHIRCSRSGTCICRMGWRWYRRPQRLHHHGRHDAGSKRLRSLFDPKV